MKTLLFFVIGLLLTIPSKSQPDPQKNVTHWLTTVQMGVATGRVRPDQPVYSGGWYRGYYPPYYTSQREAGNRIGLTIHLFSGYRWSNRLVTGLATGVDYYNNSAFFPLAGHVQGDLFNRERRLSPFYTLEGGYAFRGPNPHGNDLHGGFLWNPGLGVRINKGNGTGFIVSAGYRQQQARYDTPVDGVYTLSQTEDRRYNRLYFRMGFSF
ncbi:MAG: hypothetical protein H7319_01925 [Spirosoma sp.]|nr:hypothetical protein [Spirosoma sp.]